MTWTKKDRVLFTILNQFGKDDLEKQIEDASKKFVKLKTKPEFFVVFGHYDLAKDEFILENNMNKMTYDFFKKGYLPVFGSDETVKKLCRPVVKLDKKDMNVIPYLLEIINAAFSVIRFKSNGLYTYALVKLDGVRESFDFEKFRDSMFLYRSFDKIDKKYVSRHFRKTTKAAKMR